jgi:hypothetical protein
MHRPIEEMAARQWDAPAKRGGKFVQSMEQHLSATRCCQYAPDGGAMLEIRSRRRRDA